MPTNKDLKRLVRARMKKTGEAYTAARTHITKRPKPKTASTADGGSTPTATKPADFAALAGMSDEKVKAKTGCTWERWVYALDRRGAGKMSHGEIAALVNQKYKVDGWWSQMVTAATSVSGLRARGQSSTALRGQQVPYVDVHEKTVRCVGRREHSRRWLNGESVKCARPGRRNRCASVERWKHHRGRLHREGQVQELGRSGPHEAAGSDNCRPSKAVLVGSAGRTR